MFNLRIVECFGGGIGGMAKKLLEEVMAKNFPNLMTNYKPTGARHLMKPKQDRHKET